MVRPLNRRDLTNAGANVLNRGGVAQGFFGLLRKVFADGRKISPSYTPMRLLSLLLCGSLLSPATLPALHAALEFEATEIVVKPSEPGQKKLEAVFRFKNTGTEAVTITEVHSGCGCTVPESPKAAVAPGESGTIPVTYAAGERQGRQTQPIHVTTSDGTEFELRLVAELPARISFAPRMLLFTKGSPEPKLATLTFGDDTPVTVVEVVSKSADFELAEPFKLEGDVLKLPLRYVGVATAQGRGVVSIRTRGKSGAEHTDLLYLRHQP